MSRDAPTVALFLDDPLLDRMETTVQAQATHGGRPSLILDRTVFYPESGGQPPDQGTLAGHAVLDVQKDEGGRIHHLLDGPLPAVGSRVEGRLDLDWRRRNMAQHTGQHMLSQAVWQLFGAKTVSSHLGPGHLTIDVDQADLGWEQVCAAEAAVNGVIARDLPVRCWIPEPEALAEMTLRRRPKVDRDIRVVEIGDYDLVPCGGTHCTHTAQVGLLLALSAERYKGLCRITFAAGPQARELARDHHEALRLAARALGCAPIDVGGRTERALAQAEESRQALAGLQRELARRTAQRLLSETTAAIVIACLDAIDAPDLREVAKRVALEAGRVAVLFGPHGDGFKLVCIRGQGSTFDCGAFIRRLAEKLEVKGGGRPDHAEALIGATGPALVEKSIRTLL